MHGADVAQNAVAGRALRQVFHLNGFAGARVEINGAHQMELIGLAFAHRDGHGTVAIVHQRHAMNLRPRQHALRDPGQVTQRGVDHLTVLHGELRLG